MPKFKPGESGNPNGRPKGKETHSTQIRKLLQTHSEALTNKLIDSALGGDMQAMKLCFERLLPKAEHASLDLDLPEEINFTNLDEVKRLILLAAIEGQISPADAASFSALVSNITVP